MTKQTSIASIIIIIHVKRDSDCNGNEKGKNDKATGGKNYKNYKIKTNTYIYIYIYIYEMGVIYKESRGREGIKLSLTKQQQ